MTAADTRRPPPPPYPPAAVPPPPPITSRRPARDPGRRAAAWITGTGAFLLVAAATVFVGVRWSALPLEVKTAIVGGATGAVLVTGARLRTRLPVAGSALVHLGAFLLPVDLAALLLRVDLPWPRILVAEGLLVVAVFPLLARLTPSRVLDGAALAGAVVLATGLAAETGVPAPVVLGVAAVALAVAEVRRPAALPRAAVLALAVLGGPLVVTGVAAAADRLADAALSGWAGPLPLGLVLGPALAAVGVLAVTATTRRSRALVYLAVLAPLAAVATVAVRAPDLSRAAELVQAPLVLLLLEGVALVAAGDALWQGPTRRLAAAGEVLAGLSVPCVLLVTALVVAAPGGFLTPSTPDAAAAGSLLVAVLAAAAATARRSLTGRPWWAPGVVATGVFAAAAVALVAGEAAALPAGLLLVLAAGVVLFGGSGTGRALAASAALLSGVGLAAGAPATALAVGLPAAVVGLAPAWRAASDAARRQPGAVVSGGTGLAVLGWVLLGATPPLLPTAAAAAALAAAYVAVATALDTGTPGQLGHVAADTARIGVFVVSPVAATLPPAQALLPLGVAAVLLVLDLVRTDRPALAVLAAVPVHHLLVLLAARLEAGVAVTGLWLVAAGVVWATLAAVAPGRWRLPLTGVAAVAGGTGWALSLVEQTAAGTATLAVGAVVTGLGLVRRLPPVAHVGGGLVALGAWVLLDGRGVTVIEWYVAPVAAHLLAAGVAARRREPRPGSWPAYAPAVLVLAVPALVERLAGGSGGHAVVAGAVAVAALVAGAWRRLSAPLVLGVLVVVATTLHEALAVVASVPTWAWLGAGGAVLLGAGISLERTGTSPVAAGRRVAAGLRDRFE